MEICLNCRCRLHKWHGCAVLFSQPTCFLCPKPLFAITDVDRVKYLKYSKPQACDMSMSQSMALANFTRNVFQNASLNEDDVNFILGSLRQIVKRSGDNARFSHIFSVDAYYHVCATLMNSKTDLSGWLDEDGNTFLHLLCILCPNDSFQTQVHKYIEDFTKYIEN